MKCISCEKELTGRQKKFCSKRCKSNSNNCYQIQCKRGLERKKQMVRELGGKCQVCGYSKNLAALCFHHMEGEKKEMRLDLRHLSNHCIEAIQKEIKKCILLCANCHMELHYPNLMVPQGFEP